MITNIFTTIITGFCACRICCGPNAKGITANGSKPTQGITVAASRTIPFGSTVLIPSINPTNRWKVQDRLAKRYDQRVDIYFQRHIDAKRFGIRTNKVIVIMK